MLLQGDQSGTQYELLTQSDCGFKTFQHPSWTLTDRMCGGHRQLQISCKEDPDHGTYFRTEHAVHENRRIALKGARVCDRSGNGPGHVATKGYGTHKLEDGGDAARTPDLESLATHGCAESIGHIVCTCRVIKDCISI